MDNTFLSDNAYLIKFGPINLDFGRTFIAYLDPNSYDCIYFYLFSTRYTSPKEPLPIYNMIRI